MMVPRRLTVTLIPLKLYPKRQLRVLNGFPATKTRGKGDRSELRAIVQIVLEPALAEVRRKEAATAKLLAHYVEKQNEVAAVQFESITADQLLELHATAEKALQASFQGDQLGAAKEIAAEILEQYTASNFPYQGITVICPIDGSGAVRYSLAQNASGPAIHLEDGRGVVESVSNGRLCSLTEAQAQRYSHLIQTEEVK